MAYPSSGNVPENAMLVVVKSKAGWKVSVAAATADKSSRRFSSSTRNTRCFDERNDEFLLFIVPDSPVGSSRDPNLQRANNPLYPIYLNSSYFTYSTLLCKNHTGNSQVVEVYFPSHGWSGRVIAICAVRDDIMPTPPTGHQT